MKKVILGTTALVLTAGVAFADAHTGVSVSGGADLWVEDKGGDIQVKNSINIDFAGSGETDGGLGFGFDYTLLDAVSAVDASVFSTTTDSVTAIGLDNWEVYISGSWGKLTVGDPDDALQSVAGLSDIGFDNLGFDNYAEFGRGIGNSQGVLYSNTLGAASIYLSMNKDTGVDDMSIGLSFDAGPVKIGVGYEDLDTGAVDDVTAVDVSGSFGAIGFDAMWIDHDLGTGYGTVLSYDAGMATIDFGYADRDNASGAPSDAVIAIGFSTDLGGGAELAGGVADNGTDTVWDLGIGMSF